LITRLWMSIKRGCSRFALKYALLPSRRFSTKSRFELEVAAVEIVKIVADKPGYGRVRLAESKFTEIAAEM
jgi:hypothetical protein